MGFVALKPRPRRAYVLTQQAVNILKYLTVLRCSVMCEAVTVGTARRHQIVDVKGNTVLHPYVFRLVTAHIRAPAEANSPCYFSLSHCGVTTAQPAWK